MTDTSKASITFCRRNCGNRIKQMTEFWKESDCVPNIHVQKVVREVTLDECSMESNWFCANQPCAGPFKEDLHCDEASAACCLLLAFPWQIKTLPDGDCRSADDVWKCLDAITWGAKTAKQRLPADFCKLIGCFHKGCKREHADARKKGSAMDTAADPISMALCEESLG